MLILLKTIYCICSGLILRSINVTDFLLLTSVGNIIYEHLFMMFGFFLCHVADIQM